MAVPATNATVFWHAHCLLKMAPMEPTRIIPITVPRSAPSTDFIRLETVNGQEQLSGGEPENAPRFAGEVHYVSYYATRLAETLGMRRLEACILEDRDGQTSMAAGGQPGSWRGTIQTTRRSIKQVLESFGR